MNSDSPINIINKICSAHKLEVDKSDYLEFEKRICVLERLAEGGKAMLSTREVEVLGLVSRGFISKEIADKLFLSVNTVNNHRQNILEKINAANTFEAITYARNLGLL